MFFRQCRAFSTSIQELSEQIRQCAKSKALADGKQIHAGAARMGLDETTFVGNLLVQMYGSCRHVEAASGVFAKIRDRNVFSWNIMMTAYAQNGYFGDARGLFERMPFRDPVSWNVIITAFVQRGLLPEARKMFDQTPDHDIVTWNAMIAAYAQNGYCEEALGLFRLMQIEGILADRITFTCTLDACADASAISQGKIIHSEIVASGIVVDRRVHNSLINMYAKAGEIDQASLVFNSMVDRDVVSWTALMMAFSQNGHLPRAKEVFEKMPQRDIMAWNALVIDYARKGELQNAMALYRFIPLENPVSSTTMIAAFAQNGHLQESREIFDKLCFPDVVAWNAIIAAYVQHSEFREALKIFQAMVVSGAEPNRITFISSLHACARVAVLDAGKAIHEEILIRSMHGDVTLVAMLISMYGRCGQVTKARKLFDQMPKYNLLWNTMLAAYAQNGHSIESLDLFHEMNMAGVAADEVSFIIVLSACSQAGLLRSGWEYFRSMAGDHGIAPVKDHFVCMIDLMGRTGQLEKAEDLIVNMPYEPDIVSWTSLVGACRVHRDSKRGARLSKLALASNPRSSSPYALLSNLFCGKE